MISAELTIVMIMAGFGVKSGAMEIRASEQLPSTTISAVNFWGSSIENQTVLTDMEDMFKLLDVHGKSLTRKTTRPLS